MHHQNNLDFDDTNDGSPMSSSTADVEAFNGKIVYNLDGSAYIIDTANATDSSLNLNTAKRVRDIANATTSTKATSAAAGATTATSKTSSTTTTTTTSTATTTKTKLTTKAGELHEDDAFQAAAASTTGVGSTGGSSGGADSAVSPKIHSFRVVSAHDAVSAHSLSLSTETANAFKIQKPILMCFICKLSFGNTKSFSSHANSEHSLNLKELEKQLLNCEYSSAIIQRNMDEKPQISFLEPLDVNQMSGELLDAEGVAAPPAKTASRPDERAQQQTQADNDVGDDDGDEDEAHDSERAAMDDVEDETPNVVREMLMDAEHEEAEAEATSSIEKFGSLNSATTKTNSNPMKAPSLILNNTAATTATTAATSATTTATPTTLTAPAVAATSPPEPLVSSNTNLTTATATTITTASPPNNNNNSGGGGDVAYVATSTDNLSSNKLLSSNASGSNSCRQSPSPMSPALTEASSSVGAGGAVSDFLQQQLQQCMTSPLGGADSLLLHQQLQQQQQQQQQQASFQPPQPTATSLLSPHNHFSSLHASLAAALVGSGAANDPNAANGVKLISEFLQQQLSAAHQEHFASGQQQQQQPLNSCPDHPDYKGIDCKTCELIGVQQQLIRSPLTPQRSPNSSAGGGALGLPTNLSMSPTTSVASVGNAAASNAASSFTIGACSEHINGRPQGMDCARCEMILNSARLNSGVQMSTRNSCKTLKCPQCNWHYKYQETLEIHMREKHPDGESACGYCLAGQQHPRLARGESYSCGYKPYRCEICNYSTTTKGNLSIHMQSDKHLNNMQELNSSQNMVAAAAAAAAANSKLETAGNKLLLANNMSQAVQAPSASASSSGGVQASVGGGGGSVSGAGSSGSAVSSGAGSLASSKPKPSFRCDICSYETSVARNLRIHMTSEKHTHNMAVLQNNIKQIQAFNFLQQQQQQQQQQAAACGMAGGANSFLPEVALADLAYNQAIMIQLLHQNAAVAQVAQAAAASHQLGDAKTPTKASTPTSPTSSLAAAVAGSGEQPTQQPPTPSSSPFSFAPKPALPPIKFPTSLSRPEDFRQQQQQQLLVEQPLPPLTQPLSSPAPNSCDPLESTPTKPDMWPTALYSCLVCDAFNTNNLDELNQHLLIDRSRQSSNASAADIMLIHNNNYICRLCNYKTNLKANFQLHSKTDKHLQKLNYINHIREGGPRNEYKLQFQQQQSPQLAANSVQLKCNCCDFYTNSIQKLSLHTQHMRHDTMRLVFHHLVYIAQQHQLPCNASTGVDVAAAGGIAVKTEPPECQEDGQPSKHHLYQFNGKKHRVLLCQLCNFNANTLLDMIQHVKSLRHVQVEQFICLQRRSENLEMPGLEDVFKVTEQLTDKTDDIHVGEPNFAQTLNLSTSASGVGIDNTPGSDIGVGVGFSPVSSTCSITSNKPQMTNEVAAEQSIVYKCNHCDYFVQFKKEMESHIEVLHPNVETDDYLSIPTNAAALHAFKTAVAAATLAAVQRCNTRASPVVPLPEEDDCPAVVIKKERADDEEELSTQSTIAGANDDTHTNANANEEERTAHSESKKEPASVQNVQCPLCQDNGFTEKQQLELHLMRMHSVNRDGLARLLQLVDNSVWQNMTTTTATSGSSGAGAVAVDKGASDAASGADQQRSAPSAANPTLLQAGLSCQQCEASFKHEEQLLQHAQQSQHYALQGGDYLCLAAGHTNRPCHLLFPTLPAMIAHYKDTHMSLVISERHVYKYRCKQCSLAFKTQQKLTTHMLYHTMRDATKCALCQRSFRSTQALQKHMEQAHAGECGSSGSPRVVSPSLDTEAEKPIGGAAELNYPETTNIRATEADNVGNKLSLSSSPSPSPSHHMDVHQESKDLTMPKQTAHIASPLSPPTNLNSSQQQQQQQQQHIAAITAALLKQQQQQQQQQQSQDVASDILQHLQMEPTLLNQKFMQQNQQQLAQHFSNMTSPSSMQNIQNLQSLQQIQQLPQLAAAAAASGMPLNPVDMLNLMQFHHLMSLNFMNLAPPLIFGANANATGGASGGGSGVAGASAAAVPNNCNVGGELQKTTPATGNATNVGATTSAVETAILPPQAANSSATNAQQIANNQKRARTRITDDQLKILRAHFDINNSPSEESIMEMSQKANLPMKVVKHWFRNTLFKERQRNKDSPYNFNNPPSTTLNLEEYERTGQTKVLPLMDTALNAAGPAAVNAAAAAVITTTAGTSKLLQQTQSRPESTQSSGNISDYMSNNLSFGQPQELNTRPDQQALLGFPLEVHIKTEPGDEQTAANSADCDNQLLASTQAMTFLKQQQQRLSELTEQQHQQQQQQDADMQDNQSTGTGCSSIAALQQQQQLQQQHQHAQANNYETKSESGSSDVLSRPQTPNSTSASNLYNSMNELLSQQLENMNNMGPPKKFQLNKVFEKNSPAAAQFDTNSNSSNSSSTSSGKRANRTRFTDYQIKVLQEFFENNSYPKDSDLEYLSKLLLLSPRVIVVWFQNARQKQRKIYENQPNNTLYESEEKKQNINYACKKCNLVFQRYYELIRHQKNHCFKEENNKKSAKAQIAAAQIAQNLSSEDSNSSMDIHHHNSNAALLVGSHQQHVAAVAAAAALASAGGGGVSGSVGANLMATSPQHLFSKSSSLTDFSPSTTPTPPQRERSNSLDQQTTTVQHKSSQKHECDKCKMCFSQFEQLREHQLMHLMNPGLFGVASGQQQQQQQTAAAAAVQDAPPFGPFGSILQSLQQAAQQQQLQQHILQQQQQQQQQQPPPPAKKRKYSETSSNADDVSSLGEYDTPSKKYDFLYQYFMQNEVNTELKQQFLAQQQQQPNESEFEMDFLANYYQQTELKKRSNYDFLYQYYMKSEDDAQQQQQQHHQQQQPPQHHHQIAGKKPSIDFLLQYYQLNESKKFFQLGASAQRTHDGTIQASSSSELPTTTTDDKVAEYSAISEQSGNNNNNNNNNNNDGDNGNTKQDDIDKSCTNNNNNNNNNSSVEAFENNEDVPMQAMDEAEAAQTETIGHESPTPLAVDNNCAMKMEKNNKRQCKRKAANSSPIAQNHHYFQNLEDFLDASMTENTSETLTFGDEKVTQLQSGPMAVVGHESPPQPMQQQQQQFKIDDQKQQQQTKQNKRLRTTILPEQLNFLYECYQTESNPSRKMLEEISKKVNLKKRVVQVWYQNSRARERKGQFRQNLQIIHKKCPYCGGIFKVKSALEWHLQSKHNDRPKINIETIPNIGQEDTLSDVMHDVRKPRMSKRNAGSNSACAGTTAAPVAALQSDIQVWFQNSRAKDKKSRNQRQYAHVSDDNSSYDDMAAKDISTNGGGSNVKAQLVHNASGGEILVDCQICQVPQVNLQQHAFTVEHMRRVKELLEHTTSTTTTNTTAELYSNASGSDENDNDPCANEKRFFSLSKALLLQHAVAAAAGVKSNASSLHSGDQRNGHDQSLLLNFNTTTEDRSDEHTNNDSAPDEGMQGKARAATNLMQQLFKCNQIPVMGGK